MEVGPAEPMLPMVFGWLMKSSGGKANEFLSSALNQMKEP
jgi:hypothetical protein